jgi:hypothetical protein
LVLHRLAAYFFDRRTMPRAGPVVVSLSEEFAEIRNQFQRLHAELDQNMLFLDVCHWPDGKTQSESVAEHCKVPFELLGLMHIPIVHPVNHDFLFKENPLAFFNEVAAASIDKQNRGQAQYQIVGFPEADQRPPRRLKVAYLRCPNETTRQVAHEFRTLAKQAGAALPAVVLDAIPTLFDTNSYIDRWLEFVFWQHPPRLDDLWHLNCTENTHIFSIPCEDSARSLTECGLDTAAPIFRPRKGQWPEWAGFGPLDADNKTDPDPMTPCTLNQSTHSPDADAVEMLFGWQEILDIVIRPSERAERDRIKRLNESTNGPIQFPKRGGQPNVVKFELVAWWNAQMQTHHDSAEEAARKAKELSLNMDSTHNYGRDGTVITEIAGSEKKRRET